MGQNPVQPLLAAGRQLRKICPMRNVRPHHVPGRRIHPEGVAGVEGLLEEGEHKAAAVRVRKEGGPGEADSVVGAAGMGMAGGLCSVLKVVRDLDTVIVLEPGKSLKQKIC